MQKAIPALAHLASLIGDPAVRYRGTIGGSLANNDPAADYPAAVLALGATVKTNKRSIAADDFFKGLFTTALEDGEIITAVSFPIPAKAGYSKFPHPASRFALTGVFVAKTKSGDVRVDRDRCIAKRRHAGTGDRGGLEGQLVGRSARWRENFGGRDALRHSRHVGLPRQPGQGHGATRGDRRRLNRNLSRPMHAARSDARRTAFGTILGKSRLPHRIRRDNLANQLIKNFISATDRKSP